MIPNNIPSMGVTYTTQNIRMLQQRCRRTHQNLHMSSTPKAVPSPQKLPKLQKQYTFLTTTSPVRSTPVSRWAPKIAPHGHHSRKAYGRSPSWASCAPHTGSRPTPLAWCCQGWSGPWCTVRRAWTGPHWRACNLGAIEWWCVLSKMVNHDAQSISRHLMPYHTWNTPHRTSSLFHQARSVPNGDMKTIFDAWYGYHIACISAKKTNTHHLHYTMGQVSLQDSSSRLHSVGWRIYQTTRWDRVRYP